MIVHEPSPPLPGILQVRMGISAAMDGSKYPLSALCGSRPGQEIGSMED